MPDTRTTEPGASGSPFQMTSEASHDSMPHRESANSDVELGVRRNVEPRLWEPLKLPVYRSFWIAGLVSNMGTWMHELGAQWLMASMDPNPIMVSAVRTSMTVPIFCLALPAGVWADRFDRRQWLLFTQVLLLCIAAIMATLAASDWLTPWLLLAFTAAMGVAVTLNHPAWQALTPELVPPSLLPSAISIGSISFNLARSIGPALAGLLIAKLGVWSAFGFNAFSFLAIIAVLIAWQQPIVEEKRTKPEFFNELRKGLYVVQNSPTIRNALIRLFAFSISGSILWSLLALVVTDKLQFAAKGFGLCLGLIGGGAVTVAWLVPLSMSRLKTETILLVTKLTFGSMCLMIGFSERREVILPCLFVIGMGWMATMTSLNATAQMHLPRKFRARGMAAYLVAFSLGMAIGSMFWGWLAYASSLSTAFIVAGSLMATLAFALHRLPLERIHAK